LASFHLITHNQSLIKTTEPLDSTEQT